MNNSIIEKAFDSFPIRIHADQSGKHWFAAQDVSNAIGYAETNRASNLCRNVPEEWKGVYPLHTLGGVQSTLCLSQEGLFFFLGRSDKPKALPFQKWVYGEVLPSLADNGQYSIQPVKPPTQMQILAQIAQQMANQEQEQLRQAEIQSQQAALLTEQKDHLERIDQVLDEIQVLNKKPSGSESMSQLAKRISQKHGIPQERVKEIMDAHAQAPGVYYMIKNDNEHAKGSTYAVYRVGLVTKFFERFIKECEPVPLTGKQKIQKYTHDCIPGHVFKINQ